MLRSNPRQEVKEMAVACLSHVSSIEFSEFGEKKWSIFHLAGQQKGEMNLIDRNRFTL